MVAVLCLAAVPAQADDTGGSGRAPTATNVVTGTVRVVHADGSVVRLAFDDDPASLQIVLISGWLSHFPAHPDEYYRGKTVAVRGAVSTFRGRRELIVRDGSDITVLDAPVPTADRARVEPNEIDRLRERVRDLEQRVHALEQRVPTGGR